MPLLYMFLGPNGLGRVGGRLYRHIDTTKTEARVVTNFRAFFPITKHKHIVKIALIQGLYNYYVISIRIPHHVYKTSNRPVLFSLRTTLLSTFAVGFGKTS